MMVKLRSVLILILLLAACGMPMGDRVDAKNLQVYYMEGVSKEEAISFATYWRDNAFVGEDKQVVQLTKVKETLVVKLIEKATYHDEPLTIDELSRLQELGRTLSRDVFKGRNTEIVITDNTFRPIER